MVDAITIWNLYIYGLHLDGDEDVVLLTLLPENPQKSLNIFKYNPSDSNFEVSLYPTNVLIARTAC